MHAKSSMAHTLGYAQAETVHVVYLMQQGERFRVGWCKLFRHDGTLHLGVRSHLEHAEAAWILHTTTSRTEASMYEQWVSITFGIPTITFRPIPGATHMTKEAIDWLFHRCKDLTAQARTALEYHGRVLTQPLGRLRGQSQARWLANFQGAYQ